MVKKIFFLFVYVFLVSMLLVFLGFEPELAGGLASKTLFDALWVYIFAEIARKIAKSGNLQTIHIGVGSVIRFVLYLLLGGSLIDLIGVFAGAFYVYIYFSYLKPKFKLGDSRFFEVSAFGFGKRQTRKK